MNGPPISDWWLVGPFNSGIAIFAAIFAGAARRIITISRREREETPTPQIKFTFIRAICR